MRVKVQQLGEIIVFDVEGHLDFETTHELKAKCEEYIGHSQSRGIIFNIEKLKFVGSTGISQFLKTLKEFNNRKDHLKICNASVEFTKMLRAVETRRRPFDIYLTLEEAVDSFMLCQAPPSETLPPRRTVS